MVKNDCYAERAKIFMPFDALKGYKEAILEKQKVVVNKKELSEDDLDSLSRKINQLKVGMMVKVIFYEENDYICVEGILSKLKIEQRELHVVKKVICFDDLLSVEVIKQCF